MHEKPSYDQLEEMFKAACSLADRYRRERDGARAATEATKSKLVDAVTERGTVQEAIHTALRSPGATVTFSDHGVRKARHAPGQGHGTWRPQGHGNPELVRQAARVSKSRIVEQGCQDDELARRMEKVHKDIHGESGLGRRLMSVTLKGIDRASGFYVVTADGAELTKLKGYVGATNAADNSVPWVDPVALNVTDSTWPLHINKAAAIAVGALGADPPKQPGTPADYTYKGV